MRSAAHLTQFQFKSGAGKQASVTGQVNSSLAALKNLKRVTPRIRSKDFSVKPMGTPKGMKIGNSKST